MDRAFNDFSYAHRSLHGKEGHDLQQVVLQHVSDDAVGIEVAPTTLCAKVLAEDDLNISDELPAPQRLEHQICKSEHLCHHA